MLYSCNWLEGTEQDPARGASRETRNIQAEMISVDEIDVGVSWRSEQHRIARGFADRGVGSRVLGTEIGLDFNDPSGEKLLGLPTNQKLAE